VARTTPPIAVPLQTADQRHAARVLALAFWDDPVQEYLLPDSASRLARLDRFFAWALVDGRQRGFLATTPGLDAVSVWHRPEQPKPTPLDLVRAAPMGLRVFGRRVGTGIHVLEAMERLVPREPHWYLSILGTDPSRRGTGAGAAVMQVGLDHADEHGIATYLVSSKERNLSYYARFGFDVLETITLPGAGPTMWTMWRPAR